jgi:pyruvate dehydrogenase E2 component (dihydrolipoamide acetyltransferase)
VENGLVVPPIRDAGDLNLQELHDVAKDIATRARDGKLMPDELSGSTFTVSNMGMMGVDNFNAIINPGEAGILAVASTIPTPTAVNGRVKVRSIMKTTLSVDHRIVDGTDGAEFINAIKNKLEDVELWKSLT